MCSAQVQVNIQPTSGHAFSPPQLHHHNRGGNNPFILKMSLDYISPPSNQAGPQLPPIQPQLDTTENAALKEKPTLPSLSQCHLDLPRDRIESIESSRDIMTMTSPLVPQLFLPASWSKALKPSPSAGRYCVEPYSKLRNRRISPFGSSSSNTSTRSSTSPRLSPNKSPRSAMNDSLLRPNKHRHSSFSANRTRGRHFESQKQHLNQNTSSKVHEDTMIHASAFASACIPRLYSVQLASSPLNTRHLPSLPLSFPLPPPSTISSCPTSPTTTINTSSSLGSSTNHHRTSERPEYDPEELFAIAYLRLSKPGAVPWKEVKTAFQLLFPPDTLRRLSSPTSASRSSSSSAKNLLPTYSERDVGGLECRYYRIRTQERMGTVRKHRKNSDSVTELEKEALRNMQRELVKDWVKAMDNRTKFEYDLVLKVGESARGFMERAIRIYENKSEFWGMLQRVRTLAVAGAFASRD